MARKRRYQSGGLAAYAKGGDVDEESPNDTLEGQPTVGGLGAIVENVLPAELQQSISTSRDLNKSTYEKAIERLRLGREALMKMQPYDKSAKWLALAQGMLAPTKTGGFGESVSNAAGLIRQQQEMTNKGALERQVALQDIDKTEAGAEGDYATRDVALTGQEAAYRSGVNRAMGSAKVLGDWDVRFEAGDPNAKALGLDNSVAHTAHVIGTMDPDGTPHIQLAKMDGTDISPEVAKTINPTITRLVTLAGEQARTGAGLSQADLNHGLAAMNALPKVQQAYSILAKIDREGKTTSGLKNDFLKATEYFGVTEEMIPEGVGLLAMQNLTGQVILDKLAVLTGSKSNLEYTKIEEQIHRMGGNTKTNMQILQNVIGDFQHYIREGKAATELLKNSDPETYTFLKGKFDRFEKDQAGGGAAEPSRKPPPDAVRDLLDSVRNAPDDAAKAAELQDFRKNFDVDEATRVELLKLGAKI